MDWKVFLATFAAVFVAELADKTQFVGIAMTVKSGKPFAVLVGSVCAYALVTLISVLIGTFLGKYIKPELVRYSAALLFIILGALILFKII
ncbi:MAG: TMEM165/GDT1 family protein [Candidatus Omnitrophica bacterium]|nr:TMEM165/GDT1 family protein [Candidatus Omnitrophota bacterium]